MDVILVRHGLRIYAGDTDDGSLTVRGRHDTQALGRALKLRGLRPTRWLSSERMAAIATAELLSHEITDQVIPPKPIDALTPASKDDREHQRIHFGGIERVILQADLTSCPAAECIVIVGHEGRLSNLVIEMTGGRSRPIPHSGAVCVHADDLSALLSGRGSIAHRYPTVDHQEEQLREKVSSKMTTSTFLAGFVFTALSTVLLLSPETWPWHRIVAVITLTASLGLLLAAVFIYDQLSMPAGFWTRTKPRPPWKQLYERRDAAINRRWDSAMERSTASGEEAKMLAADEDPKIYAEVHDGPMYLMMVKTSRLVFTPAVVLALGGFVALLIGTNNRWMLVGGLVAMALALTYSGWYRPNLGAD